MLRGSSFLFRETNLLHYVRVVEVIEEYNKYLRGWDVPDYLRPEVYEHFACAWSELRSALLSEGGQGLTLVSKVMMGVWGCIPSFDTYFRATFRGLAEDRTERGAWSRAGTEALRLLHEVHEQHGEEIEAVRAAYPVWSFTSGGPAARGMTSAKVLDIYGFYEGWKR